MADSAVVVPSLETPAATELSLSGAQGCVQELVAGRPADLCQLPASAGPKEDNLKGNVKHMEHTIRAIGQGLQSACLQWEQTMTESEQFEMFCPGRVDKILQEAKALEAHLLQQKEQLIGRLRNLSQTLQVGQ